LKTTTPKKLRSELKHFLEIAEKEPIKIKRRTGKMFILVSEIKYTLLIEELHALRDKISTLDKDYKYVPKAKKEKIVKATKKVAKKIKKKITKKAKKKIAKEA
jgi:PHD/YefM family antitoxin component YafN of YafNO toxin-antitoxin module